MSNKHRGRVQAQGGGLEKSESWSQDEPLTKAEGLSLLDKLKQQLTKKELKEREKQFQEAERYINNTRGGIDAVKKKSFRNRKTRDVRVDIEILAGTAFALILFLIFNFFGK